LLSLLVRDIGELAVSVRHARAPAGPRSELCMLPKVPLSLFGWFGADRDESDPPHESIVRDIRSGRPGIRRAGLSRLVLPAPGKLRGSWCVTARGRLGRPGRRLGQAPTGAALARFGRSEQSRAQYRGLNGEPLLGIGRVVACQFGDPFQSVGDRADRQV